MKIIDLYGMSEEERKKALQEQQSMYNERMQQSDEIRKQANQQFNDLISKNGQYNTIKHTTTVGALEKAYKDSSAYNKVHNSLRRMDLSSEDSIWNRIKNIASSNANNYNNQNSYISRNDNGMVNRTATAINIANQNNRNANMILKTQLYNNAYKEALKDRTKNNIEYRNAKAMNPNASEEEVYNIAENQTKNREKQFDESFKNMSEEDRKKEIYKIQKILNNNDGLFETEKKKNENKKIINNLFQKSEAIEAEKRAEKVNKTLNEGNFIERATTATGELASSMGKSAIDMTISPVLSVGSLAEGILPTKDYKGPKFDDVIDYKKMKDYGETVKNQNIENDVLKTGKGVSTTIGGMIPSIVANIVMPGSNIGMIAQATGVAGQDYIENLNEDKTNKVQSAISGTLKGLGSYATERITGGNILGKGSLDDWATRTIANRTSSKIAQKIASKIYEVGGENFEELLENQIDHLVDATVNNKGITFEEWLNEQSETVKQTTLTQLFLNLMGIGGDTYNEVQDYKQNAEMKQWIDEAQKIIDKENLSIDNMEINKNNINEVRKTLNQLPKENETSNLQQQFPQNEQNIPTQQITQEQNKVAQNGNMEQMTNQQKIDEIAKNKPSFSKQIDQYVAKKYPSGDFLFLGKTPDVLTKLGAPDNQIILKQNKLKSLIEQSNDDTSKLHGVPIETIKRLPEAIANPLNILKSSTDENSIVIITDLADKKERPIIASIKLNYDGQIGNIDFLSNRLTSAYGKNNYDKFMQTEIAKGNLLYDIDEGIIKELPTTRLQSSKGISSFDETSSFINNSIPQIDTKVNENTITNNYAQSNENNTQNKEKPTRHEVIQKNRELARENIKNISKWKDKKRGLSYQLETMERNMYDIISDKAEAQRIIDTYFYPIHEAVAKEQKFINSYNDKKKKLKLNKYEQEAVQFLGEKKYNPDFNKGDGESLNQRNEIQKRIDSNIKKGKIDIDKVNNAIELFRNDYDEVFELENKVRRENGYEEKLYRKGYYPHFIDYVPETKTEKVLNKLGFKIDKRPLPTDIAGTTEQLVPGKTWNRSALERKTNKTDYNALKGWDTYIQQAADNIFLTEHIQKLRALENEIRYQYSDKGVQERVDNILNDETLFEDEKQQLLDQILEQTNNPMPNLVTELRRYTNALANKKSEADRSIENMMGRSVYSTVNAIENRFGANAVGLNIGSAFTNIIPITQAWSQVSTKNMGRAVIDTVKSYINNDGFVDNSAFLTSRINQSEKLYKTSIEKISDKTSFLFNAIDEVTSNIVVRSKYLDNIQNGMSESEAIKNADQFARNVIADRSKGAIPTKFEEKNPITKAFTQFQLEVNNQYRYMFKDLPRDLKEKGLGSIALAFFKMFVGAWLYNEASEKITGRRPAFDPIDIATSAYKDITDEKKGTYDKMYSIGKNVVKEVPFVGGLAGGGRIPVNGAIPDVGNLTKAGVGLVTGEMDSKKAVSSIGKEVAKPLYYLLPPFGGAQIKKSVEGISTVANGGSYGVDSKGKEILQFPVENANAVDYVKAGVFGKYALPLAKEYTDNNFKSLNANQTKTYRESKIPYKEYLEYLNQGLKKNEEKIDYISKQNWGENQKWGIYTNEIFSDTERKEGGSQLEDANYAIKNGTSKAEYMKLYSETNKRGMNLPTKEEQKELKENGISLKNYVDYQTKVHDETKRQKENGALDENKQLKNKDKIEILVSSKYSDSEKEAIYKKSINSQDKKIQVVDELGLPITQYLKYRQQDFTNDKDSDDETISGTGKKKLYNYLNNISDDILSQDYKKILCKMEGVTAYDSDVARLVINKNNLTAEKQKEILKILGFKVDKNGNISTTTMIPRNKAVK